MPKPKHPVDGMGTHLTKKGYWRFHIKGRMKGMYVHRYEAAKKLGRPLREDEEVHHGRGGKQDNSHGNLTVLGKAEHGWKTAHQAAWMNILGIREEKYFYETIMQLEQEGVRVNV